MIPRALKYRKDLAAIGIQKYLRGYLTYRDLRLKMAKQKI
jgi:hypothetical protein